MRYPLAFARVRLHAAGGRLEKSNGAWLCWPHVILRIGVRASIEKARDALALAGNCGPVERAESELRRAESGAEEKRGRSEGAKGRRRGVAVMRD